jgi:uncharacterized membrane protein
MKTSKLTFAALLLIACVPLALAQGTYTQIDYPGAVDTEALGINTAGDIVGGYVDGSYNHHGFLLSGGVYTTIDDPAVPGSTAYGINDFDRVVGTNSYSSYLYDAGTGAFTSLQFPDSQALVGAVGINNAGVVVGAIVTSGTTLGFELIKGTYERLIPRGVGIDSSFVQGINNIGEAVVDADTSTQNFVFLYYKGTFQRVTIPAITPSANGINDAGAIVGSYRPTPQGSPQGFLYQNGVFQEIAFPGSSSGFAWSINNSGVIVGSFVSSGYAIQHGFTWTPPPDAAKK